MLQSATAKAYRLLRTVLRTATEDRLIPRNPPDRRRREGTRTVAQAPGRPPVGQNRPDPVPQLGDIAGLDQEPGLAMSYHLGRAAEPAADDGVPLTMDSIAARPGISEIPRAAGSR